MSKKLSQREFIQRAFNTNSHIQQGHICIIGDYTGMAYNVLCHCNKCNLDFSTSADGLVTRNYGCPKCGRATAGYKQRKSNEQFQLELANLRKFGHDIYCDDTYKTSNTKLTFYCSRNHTWQAAPHKILIGQGCPICAGKQVQRGFNDIATTAPLLATLLNNYSDAYKYTKSSHHKVAFKCPDCGYILKKPICLVNARGLGCPRCSSGISYPNRLGRAIFEQLLGEDFIAEYSSDWTDRYIYDIYFCLNDQEYVVEFDGAQHYDDHKHFSSTYDSQREVDYIKNKLAANNHVHMIRIDCSLSDLSYIRNSIENSELNRLLDLSKIDWHTCNSVIQTNLVKTTCTLWASGNYSVLDIAKQLHIGRETVKLYIKRGFELGWCQNIIKPEHPGNSKVVKATKLDTGITTEYLCASDCKNDLLVKYNFKISLATLLKHARLHSNFNGFHFELVK